MATEAVEERKLEVEASMEEEDEEEEESKEGRKGEGRGAVVVEEEEEEDWPTFQEINEEEKEGEEERGKKRKGKGPRKDSDLKEKEPPATPTGRPARERKTVERYSAPSVGRSVTKGLTIEKGRGIQLKDIPNVEFKLSKRKPDENLRMLHSILFGKKATVHSLKRNIRQFSGYVWLESEQEKQRAKIKEKLDKCVKEKLLDFCDVLNIPINKAAVRKEELSAKLLEFLESPHATTDVSLAEKEQKGKMRKRKVLGKTIVSRETSGEASSKKQKQKHTVDEEDESGEKADDPLESQDDSHEDVDDTASKEEKEKEDSESEEEEEEQEGMKEQPSSKKSLKKNVKEGSVARKKGTSTPVKKSTQEKSVKSPEKSTKKASGSKRSAVKIEDASVKPSKSKGSASKTRKSEKGYNSSNKGKPSSKKETSNSKAKSSTAGEGKTNSVKKQKAEPTREEMHEVVVDILKKVDFNTATLSDILRQLGAHFDVDLMHRKAEVKAIITDVINSMSDDEEEEVEFEALDGDGAGRNKDEEDDA